MKANELMIGNLYLGYDNEIHKIDIDFFVSVNNQADIDKIIKEPIPLTEEWLTKMGFEKHKPSNEIHLSKGIFHWYSSTGAINLEFDNGLRGYDYSTEVDQVHQLQNLYFALTGEELEVKNG